MCSSFMNCTTSAVLCYCCLFKLIYSSTTNQQGLWFMPKHVGKITKDVYMTISSGKMKRANIAVWSETFIRCFCVWQASWKTEYFSDVHWWHVSYRVANMALREEKVAASSFRALSSFLSFIMVSVTIAFSFSYLLLRFARATSAVCGWTRRTKGSEQLDGAGIIFPDMRRLLIWTTWPFFSVFESLRKPSSL